MHALMYFWFQGWSAFKAYSLPSRSLWLCSTLNMCIWKRYVSTFSSSLSGSSCGWWPTCKTKYANDNKNNNNKALVVHSIRLTHLRALGRSSLNATFGRYMDMLIPSSLFGLLTVYAGYVNMNMLSPVFLISRVIRIPKAIHSPLWLCSMPTMWIWKRYVSTLLWQLLVVTAGSFVRPGILTMWIWRRYVNTLLSPLLQQLWLVADLQAQVLWVLTTFIRLGPRGVVLAFTVFGLGRRCDLRFTWDSVLQKTYLYASIWNHVHVNRICRCLYVDRVCVWCGTRCAARSVWYAVCSAARCRAVCAVCRW
jgi:hypothetical protein